MNIIKFVHSLDDETQTFEWASTNPMKISDCIRVLSSYGYSNITIKSTYFFEEN